MSLVGESPPDRFSSFQPGARKLPLHRVLPRATRTLLMRGKDVPTPQWQALSRRQTVLQERRKLSGLPAPLMPTPHGASERQDQGARSLGLGSEDQHALTGMPGPNASLPGLSPATVITDHTQHV